MVPPYNPNEIIDSIVNAPISPSAREIAGDLVDAWIQENGEFDAQYETLAVESPWYLWLDSNTLLVGVMDRIAKDELGPFGCEWKSAKEPQKNKDGRDSAYWNEEVWLQGISTGTQVAIYGLALYEACFVLPNGRVWVREKIDNPRIMVRAAVKSSPVVFWPTNREDGVFSYPNAYLKKVRGALLSKAAQIRAARETTLLPWALPGNHCTNRFRKLCPYYEKFCIEGLHPADKPKTIFDESDPGFAGVKAAFAGCTQDEINDPYNVIFSASSYDTSQQCPERYRILTGGYDEKEQDAALDTGTGMHIGLSSYYRQSMRRIQGTHEHKRIQRNMQKPLDTMTRKR
jgi:hypothetical protein